MNERIDDTSGGGVGLPHVQRTTAALSLSPHGAAGGGARCIPDSEREQPQENGSRFITEGALRFGQPFLLQRADGDGVGPQVSIHAAFMREALYQRGARCDLH